MSDKILSTFEVGKILGVHQITVARWVDDRRLKGHLTIGGHRRVRKSDLLEYFKSNGLSIPDGLQESDKAKVLIVDDDESVLDVLKSGLEKQNQHLDIHTAKDGFQAGHLVREIIPDLVVLDIFLPGVDGYEVCRMIKEKHKGTRVIAITGYGSEEVEKKIMAAGADMYLRKPFEIEDLMAGIESLLMQGNTVVR